MRFSLAFVFIVTTWICVTLGCVKASMRYAKYDYDGIGAFWVMLMLLTGLVTFFTLHAKTMHNIKSGYYQQFEKP